MNKLFISAVLAMSFMAMPVAAQQTTMTKAEIKAAMKAEKAQKKKEKEQSSSSAPVVVAPAPKPVTPTPAPTPVVTPAPKPVIDPYTQAQIDKALSRPQVHPLASCTYCAAFAASQGDFALVEAIGAPYTPPAAAPAPAKTATSTPADTVSTEVSQPAVDTTVTQ